MKIIWFFVKDEVHRVFDNEYETHPYTERIRQQAEDLSGKIKGLEKDIKTASDDAKTALRGNEYLYGLIKGTNFEQINIDIKYLKEQLEFEKNRNINLEKQLQDLKSKNNSIYTSRNNEEILRRLNSLELKVNSDVKEKEQQKEIIETQNRYITSLEKRILVLENSYKDCKDIQEQQAKQIIELQEKIASLEQQNKEADIESTNKPTDEYNDRTSEEKTYFDKDRIKQFILPKTDKVFLQSDEVSIKNSLAQVLKVDKIIDFLNNSSFEKKDSFIKIIEKYHNELQKFVDKFDYNSYDEDEVSEELTDKFFGIVQKYLLSNLMIAIYRGMKNDADREFYQGFLVKVNEYLHSCSIYTRLVKVGETVDEADYNDMNFIKKMVNDVKQDKCIDEVERLPYYINYLEDNEVQKLKYDGCLIVNMYDKDKCD